MKRYVTLSVLLLVALAMTAGHVTIQQAEQSARTFLGSRTAPGKSKTLKLARRQPLLQQVSSADDAAYYVFNVGQGEGFVMVSGDDRTPAILGYADSGSFASEQLPEHIQAWLDGYADQLAYIERTGIAQAPRLATEWEAVEPLLSSHWDQDSPYNDACPIDTETKERSVTGCAATAMAQVLYYHKYPEQTLTTIPSYTTGTLKMAMSAIPPTTIEWDLMRDSYGGTMADSQKAAVAMLMRLCGQSLKMDYRSESSSAMSIDMVNALQTYFGYDKSTQLLQRDHFDASQWEAIIYGEVAAGRPVLYGGQSSGSGHEFVVDGYDGNGLFHVNWGWGGMSDGYFLLSVLNPNNTTGIGASDTYDGYSFTQDAIVGLQHGSDEVANNRLTVYSLAVSGNTTITRTSTNRNFTGVRVKMEAYNMTGVTDTFGVGFALLDADGNRVTDDMLVSYEGIELGNYYGWGGDYIMEVSFYFGADLADGEYYIVPMSYSDAAEGWQPSYGADVWRIKATIDGRTLTLAEPEQSLNAIISPAGTGEVGKPLPLTATITNEGSYFSGTVYLYVDGTKMCGRTVTVASGETADVSFDFTPTSTGTKTVSLSLDSEENVAFAQTKVTVGSAKAYSLSTTVTVQNLSGNVLHDSHCSADITVSNKGSNDYGHSVTAMILKYDETANMYYSFDSQTRHLTLGAGASSTLHFDFYDVVNDARCIVALRYFSSGSWVWAYNMSNEFRTQIDSQPLLLTKSLTLENGDEDGVLQELTARLTAVITNNGDADAADVPVAVALCEYDEETETFVPKAYVQQPISIAQGARGTLCVAVDNLMPGASYMACVAYTNGDEDDGGNLVWTTDSTVQCFFSVSPDVQGPEPELVVGDVNADGEVGIGDIVAVTNVMAGSENDEERKARADVNNDGEVGIGDIVAITNIMAGIIVNTDPDPDPDPEPDPDPDPDPVETWTVVGTGTYTYQLYWSSDGNGTPYVEAGHEVYQSSTRPDSYKITNWGGDVDLEFTWNKDDNTCNVPAQEVGVTLSDYGTMYVGEQSDYFGEGDSSYYDPATSTFTFSLVYFVEAGYFTNTVGTETLQVTWNE